MGPVYNHTVIMSLQLVFSLVALYGLFVLAYLLRCIFIFPLKSLWEETKANPTEAFFEIWVSYWALFFYPGMMRYVYASVKEQYECEQRIIPGTIKDLGTLPPQPDSIVQSEDVDEIQRTF